MRRGYFIVLEGIDGSGTTSQAASLTSYLRSRGVAVTYTHEPSGGPVGSIIRLALERRIVGAPSEGETDRLDERTLALLYAADRADHTKVVIQPSLAQGRVVICDRYLLSSLAYQGHAFDAGWILKINEEALVPDLTVFLGLPVSRAMIRMKRARWTRDLYEDDDTLNQVSNLYDAVLDQDIPQLGPIVKVDASQKKESVFKIIREHILKTINLQVNNKTVRKTLF